VRDSVTLKCEPSFPDFPLHSEELLFHPRTWIFHEFKARKN